MINFSFKLLKNNNKNSNLLSKNFAKKISRDSINGLQEINYVDIKGNNKRKLMDKHDYVKDNSLYNTENKVFGLNINNYPLKYGQKVENINPESKEENKYFNLKNVLPDQPGGQENPNYHSFKKGRKNRSRNRHGHSHKY